MLTHPSFFPFVGGVKSTETVCMSAVAIKSVTALGVSSPIHGDVTFLGVPRASPSSLNGTTLYTYFPGCSI